ncbi:glycosyltransferase family protein [Spirosoma aerolatum]|uniref:hypothetical protein n=1 Tax=Spirosoma aerolatum TaxID=1211326 RepID=UPI0009ADC039|nr:hypothetical protein [Spirosoma aerolatum]
MRPNWIGPVAISSLFLLLFFWFKVVRFQALYYTYNDMYIFLQESYSWMNGRPVLYENIWGYDDRIHNNYAMLLWGPLIYVWGAYGAFFVQFGLTLLSYVLLLRHLAIRLANWALWLMLAVLLLGPVWFWFYEHPNIGWHPELTYFPLSILFLLALVHAHTGWLFVTATLLVLVKEDGALLAGAIHLAFLCLQYLVTNRQQSIFGILTKPRFWLVLGGWALLFIAGMAFLSFKNHAAEPEPRLQQALNAIHTGLTSREFIRTNLLLFAQTLLLLAPPIGVLNYGLYRLDWRQAGSILLVYGVGLLPILLSNWVQGATYYGTNALFDLVSLTWPPRFVLVYAFSTVYTIAFWLLYKADRVSIQRWQSVRIGLLLFIIQLPIVQYARPDFRLFTILRDSFTHRFDPQKEPLLPDDDVTVVKKLAQAIPPHSNVFVFDYLIPLFHKHYNIWPTEKQWENADLAIIPSNDFQKLGDRLPRVMKHPYKPVRLSTYTLYVTPAYEPYINAVLTPNGNAK